MEANDNVENLFILSGGGARFGWQFHALNLIAKAGFTPSMIGCTSTGTIGSFMWSKGLIQEAYDLCKDVYKNDASLITKPGIAKIKNGKLQINWLTALTQLTFKRKKIKSLMDNSPLAETLTKLSKLKPGFTTQFFFNAVSLETGRLIEYSSDEFDSEEELIKGLVASTSIPGIWPLISTIKSKTRSAKFLGDGGIVEGSPLSAMFDRMQPGKNYRIIVLNCNKIELAVTEDLNVITEIIGRTANIALNEILRTDLEMTLYRNKMALKYGETIGQKYIPIHIIEYSGNRGVFEFTEESLKDQLETAQKDVSKFLASQNV